MTSDFLHRHRPEFFLLLFLSLSSLLLTLRLDPVVAGIRASVWFLVSPNVVYSGQFFNKLDSLGGRFFHLIRAEGENFILKEQNAELSKKEMERDALEEENNRLRDLLTLRQTTSPDGIAAEVVGRDSRDWFYSIVINRGTGDHLLPSAAVISGSAVRPALVGRLMDVGEKTSKILLITDLVSAVSASIPSKGDMGLLEGRNKPWVSLKYLSPDSLVAVGDEVVTAGLGGVFPPGIPIGTVSEVLNSADGFFKEARVRPACHFGSLQEVLVLQRKDLQPKGAK